MMNEIFQKALQVAQSGDINAAQQYVNEYFGEETELNLVKCKECGAILAISSDLLATGLSGGDQRINLEIYRHAKQYPSHFTSIVGLPRGTEFPIGELLRTQLAKVCNMYNLSFSEGLDKRIKYLEDKLI